MGEQGHSETYPFGLATPSPYPLGCRGIPGLAAPQNDTDSSWHWGAGRLPKTAGGAHVCQGHGEPWAPGHCGCGLTPSGMAGHSGSTQQPRRGSVLPPCALVHPYGMAGMAGTRHVEDHGE